MPLMPATVTARTENASLPGPQPGPQPSLAPSPARRGWTPKRVLITRSAADLPHTAEIVRRCEAAGVVDIQLLGSDRLTGLRAESERQTYALAKSTLAVVVAPPSALKPQPIPPRVMCDVRDPKLSDPLGTI